MVHEFHRYLLNFVVQKKPLVIYDDFVAVGSQDLSYMFLLLQIPLCSLFLIIIVLPDKRF